MTYTREELRDFVSDQLIEPEQNGIPWSAIMGGAAFTVGAAATFLPTKNGRFGELYYKTMRFFEGLLPMGIGATFRTSENFSPLVAPDNFSMTPDAHPELFGHHTYKGKSKVAEIGFKDYLSRATGKRISELEQLGVFTKGFTWERTGKLFGNLKIAGTDQVFAENVGMMATGLGRGGKQFEWFAVVTGAKNPDFLKVIDEGNGYTKPLWMPVAAQGSASKLNRQLANGYFSSLVGRMNLLLQSPFDLEIMEDMAKKIPVLGNIKLGVKRGTGMQMLGRFAAKAGIGIAAVHSLKYFDYLSREKGKSASIPIMAGTGAALAYGLGLKGRHVAGFAVAGAVLGAAGPFSRGPITGAIESYARLRIGQAGVSKTLGLQQGANDAENMFPGITKPTTLIGMAGAGLLIGGTYDYSVRLNLAKNIYKNKALLGLHPDRDIFELTDKTINAQRQLNHDVYMQRGKASLGGIFNIDEIRARTYGSISKSGKFRAAGAGRYAAGGALAYGVLSTVGSLLAGDYAGGILQGGATALAAIAFGKKGGAAAAAVMAIPFLLREKTDPEKLKRIYSGEELIEDKAGRFWEAGRCNHPESLIKTGINSFTLAQDLEIGDQLIGSDGELHSLLKIYKRDYHGELCCITTNLDRNIQTKLTPNHIVPILRPSLSYNKDEKKSIWCSKRDCIIQEIEAGDLQVGDFVQVPISNLGDKDQIIDLVDYIKVGNYIANEDFIYSAQKNKFDDVRKSGGYKIPRLLTLSAKFGRLVGYFLSDGNLSFHNSLPTTIEFAFSIDEDEYVRDIFNITQDLFGLIPTVRKKDKSRLTKDGCLVVRICCSLLARVFFGLFYKSSRINSKNFSTLCLEGSRLFRAEIVEGFWRGDGHTDRDRKVISSSRNDYIEYLRIILLDLGLCPSTPKVEILPNYIKKNGEKCLKYRIGWSKTNAQGFVKRQDLLFVQVVEIKKEKFQGTVYDFEIDHKDHLLQNGTFLIHNSDYEGKRPRYRQHRVALARQHTKEKALYGSEERYWEDVDPFFNMMKFLVDPYRKEKAMWENGYKFPVTQVPFEDFPIIGPILGATVGQALKPRRTMNRDDFRERRDPVGPGGQHMRPAPEPIFRTSIEGTIGEQMYRFTELIGLPGFAMQSLLEKATGKSSLFEKDQYASPSMVDGLEPSWWGLNMGGMGLLCIPAGSPVQTNRGIIPIEEVKKDDQVLSRDSNFHTVTNLSCRETTETVKVVTSCFNTGLEATSNHIVPVYEFYPCHDHNVSRCIPFSRLKCSSCTKEDKIIKTVDKPIGELKVGDFLEVPLPINLYQNPILDLSRSEDVLTDEYIYINATQDFANALEMIENSDRIVSRKDLRDLGIPNQYGKEALRSWRAKAQTRRFNRNIVLDSDLAYIMGWYAAEGSINRSSIQLTLNINEEEYANELGLLCKTKFKATFGIYKNFKGNSLNLVIHSPILKRCAEILIGKGSSNKEISPILYYSSKENRAEFLRGYMQGDGFINVQKRKSGISTASRNLAIQSFLIGLSLGFRGHTNLDYLEKSNGDYPQGGKRKDTLRHYVSWSKTTTLSLQSFLDQEIDTLSIRGKGKGSFVFNNCLYIQVKELISICENKIVYDLEIENLHYFTAQFVSVHNSEGLRRYIPHKRNQINYVNPHDSGLPSWLPGPNSDYFLDFSSAEVYTKIQEPWARLPGKGYEALHPELTGTRPEDYPDYFRFKVLSDVAPYSAEYTNYDKEMSRLEAEGQLTAEQVLEVEKTRRQVNQIQKGIEFKEYQYDNSLVERKRVRVKSVSSTSFTTDTFGSAPIVFAGVNTSTGSLAIQAQNESSSLTAAQAMTRAHAKKADLSDYLREHVYPGAELDLFVHKDPNRLMSNRGGQPVIEALVNHEGTNVNQQLINLGLAERDETEEGPLRAGGATSALQRGFGAFWEGLMHSAETPLESFTPLAPVAKFIHQRNAIEEYERTKVYAKDTALWQKPIDHFLAPGIKTVANWLGWKGMPRELREEYMVNEYFDRLENLKWKNAERFAKASGDGKSAAIYAAKAGNTVVGADPFNAASVKQALNTTERSYFDAFVNANSSAQRSRISQIVSPQMKQILHAQWGKQEAEQASMRAQVGMTDVAASTKAEVFRKMEFQAKLEHEQRIADAMTDLPTPSPDWVGYDPAADVQDFKVKTILDQNMDPGNFGIFPQQIRDVERKPWVEPISRAFESHAPTNPSLVGMQRRFRRLSHTEGHRGLQLSLGSDGRRQFDFRSPGLDRLHRFLNDPTIQEF